MNRQIKNKLLVVRINDELSNDYNIICEEFNSVPSKRIRKFIEMDIEHFKREKDLLREIENKRLKK
jgi:hypothetical protein